MKKRYKLEYDWQATMIVEIDDEKFTPEILKDWNEFWSDHEYRATPEGGPHTPMLKMRYRALRTEDFGSCRALQDVRDGKIEGFPPMGGCAGITIGSFESFAFEDSDIEVE